MKVFYNEKQSTDKNVSSSPSAGKPKELVEFWLKNDRPVKVISEFSPVTREDYYRVMDKSFVDDVLDCKRNNGFDNKIPEVAETLPWTTGSLYAAAKHAYENNETTCSPTSGFHHAGYDESLGFCTFNGLMVTAAKLLEETEIKKIGILDLDMHWGNGTDDILSKFPDLKKSIVHYTFGLLDDGSYSSSRYWQGNGPAEQWLGSLPGIMNRFNNCDLVIYQAGADPHKDDPHGGALTDDQLRERDEVVFNVLKEFNVPVVWNLAGGYQIPLQVVLDIHDRTLTASLNGCV